MAAFLWGLNFRYPQVGDMVMAPITMVEGAATSVELHNIQKLVIIFRTERDRFPTGPEFDAIVRDKLRSKIKNPSLDMWRHPYLYRCTDRSFEVRSAGPDGRAFSDDDLVITWEG